MEMNIKDARQYSSQLGKAIDDVKKSLSISPILIGGMFGRNSGEDLTNIPAGNNGIYKVTINNKKSAVNDLIKKSLTDEITNYNSSNDLTKVDVNVRITMLKDLITEKCKIDGMIEKKKNSVYIKDAFSGESLTYDFACQVNTIYRKFQEETLHSLISADKTLSADTTGKLTVITDDSEQKSVTVNYPIEIRAELLVNDSALDLYNDIDKKIRENSTSLSKSELYTTFEFEPAFDLTYNVKSLIKRYIGVKISVKE